jgi:hypothetical protein
MVTVRPNGFIPIRGAKPPTGPDWDGQALAYIYSRENEAEARQAKVLTKDEARRIPKLTACHA